MRMTVTYGLIASDGRKGGIMATATQSALTQRPDTQKRSASHHFADSHRQNFAGPREEATLVLAAKGDDARAFEVLIERYQRRILRIARRFTNTREDAEDIVQQSFQKAFVYLRTFKGKSSFSTWLTRIAINEALMWLRRARRLREVSIDDLSANHDTAPRPEIRDLRAGPEAAFLQNERSRILFAAMDTLTPGTRTAVELRVLNDLSAEEAARVMGLSVGAVEGRIFHARKRLRQALKRVRFR
jgi:RNA polymerase sigma-70 factor (ECF subfamily)